jgi:ribokinase
VTRAYDIVVGTGGIGTGIFMALRGEHSLGREESRPAELLDRRDYCKLHIFSHYVQRLLGTEFPVVPHE